MIGYVVEHEINVHSLGDVQKEILSNIHWNLLDEMKTRGSLVATQEYKYNCLHIELYKRHQKG